MVTGVEVIGDRHPGREKYVVFQLAILRDVAIAVDFYAVAYAAAVIDDAVGPDRDVIADLAAFPDDDTVPSLKAPAYRRAVVEYGSRPQPGPGPKDQRLGASARHGVADEDSLVGRPVPRVLGASARAHWTLAVSDLMAAARKASVSDSHTKSTWQSVMCGNIGSDRISPAACSATGSGCSAKRRSGGCL